MPFKVFNICLIFRNHKDNFGYYQNRPVLSSLKSLSTDDCCSLRVFEQFNNIFVELIKKCMSFLLLVDFLFKVILLKLRQFSIV